VTTSSADRTEIPFFFVLFFGFSKFSIRLRAIVITNIIMMALGSGIYVAHTVAFRSDLRPMAPDHIGSSTSSRQRDLVFIVNPLGLLKKHKKMLPFSCFVAKLNGGCGVRIR